ncbi:MAG: hypothetical protein MJ175_12105, partial [Clostridia bacterium]|nr:hypothetical protein [Clostridia bacterium]
RTYDPLLVRQMLSQLSYASIWRRSRMKYSSPCDAIYYITTIPVCQHDFQKNFRFFETFSCRSPKSL